VTEGGCPLMLDSTSLLRMVLVAKVTESGGFHHPSHTITC